MRKPILKASLAAVAVALVGLFAGCQFGGSRPVASDVPAGPSSVRIAAWNMKWFPSGYPVLKPEDRKPQQEYKRIGSAARFIAWQKPDVLLLEEVRDGETCMMLCTNEALKGWSVDAVTEFVSAPDAPVPPHQNAIVSRFTPIDSGWRRWKGRGGVYPPRGYVWAVYDFGGTLCAVVGVHLKSNYIPKDAPDADAQPAQNRKMREVSARELADFARELQKRNYGGRRVEEVIVAGDFNTSIFDKQYDGEATVPTMLEAGFRDCFDGVLDRNTMPESKWYPATCFDYMFAKGKAEFHSPVVSPKSWTSDHMMISAMFEF